MTREEAEQLVKIYIEVLTLEQQVKALEEKIRNMPVVK
jgi:hypothetical protein